LPSTEPTWRVTASLFAHIVFLCVTDAQNMSFVIRLKKQVFAHWLHKDRSIGGISRLDAADTSKQL